MEFSIDISNQNDIVTTQNGTKYYLQSLLTAIKKFNETCPKNGGMIIRDHIGHTKEQTHVTNFLKYENNKLMADIEPLGEFDITNKKIKPIISTPLQLGSGVEEIKKILEIVNILLEN